MSIASILCSYSTLMSSFLPVPSFVQLPFNCPSLLSYLGSWERISFPFPFTPIQLGHKKT